MHQQFGGDDDSKWLWTGESVFCQCTHHIQYHEMVNSMVSLLLAKPKPEYRCKKCKKCDGFVSYKKPGSE